MVEHEIMWLSDDSMGDLIVKIGSTGPRSFCAVILAALFSIGMNSSAFGDPVNSFHKGDRIEYKPTSWQDVWEEGVVESEPAYGNVVVRMKPDQFFPRGEVKGFTDADVRHTTGKLGNNPNDAPPNPFAAVAPPAVPQRQWTPPAAAPMRAPELPGAPRIPAGAGGGPMTRAEVLGFLKANLPNGGNSPNADAVRKQLIDMIKKRGVNFHEMNPGEIYTAGGYSVQDNIPDAINSNLGAPISQNWLFGKWNMYVIGAPNLLDGKDGWTYQTQTMVAQTGFLNISPNGTYTWKVEPGDTPAQYIHGTWRAATDGEMGKQGGVGVVLQNAADGADWIAMKNMSPNAKKDNIEVEHMVNRGAYRRVGERG